MMVQTTTDAAAILRLVDAALDADPVRNTIYGSIRAAVLGEGGDGWCAHVGPAVAARGLPTTPVALTEGWTRLAPLADALGGLPSLVGIGGPVASVDGLVESLDREPAARVRERLFRLDELREPLPISGGARLAVESDTTFLTAWYTAFVLEAFGHLPPEFDARAHVERGITVSRSWLWEDAAGAAVAMAVRHPAVRGVSRIGPVYTPPDSRGRGFGTSVTAAATRDTLADDVVPVLYTDVANPTSNKIYQALGYYPVGERAAVSFG